MDGLFDSHCELHFPIDLTAYPPDKSSIWLTSVAWTRLPWSETATVKDTRLPSSVEFDYIRYFEPKDEAVAKALNIPVKFVSEAKPAGAKSKK